MLTSSSLKQFDNLKAKMTQNTSKVKRRGHELSCELSFLIFFPEIIRQFKLNFQRRVVSNLKNLRGEKMSCISSVNTTDVSSGRRCLTPTGSSSAQGKTVVSLGRILWKWTTMNQGVEHVHSCCVHFLWQIMAKISEEALDFNSGFCINSKYTVLHLDHFYITKHWSWSLEDPRFSSRFQIYQVTTTKKTFFFKMIVQWS